MPKYYTPPKPTGTSEFQGMNREMWDDYFTRFATVQESLTKDQTPELMEKAGINANAAFDSAEGTLSRQRRGLGLRASAEQDAVDARRLGLGRALATADARNRARWTGEENLKAGQAESFNASSTLSSMAHSMFGQSAQNDNQREIDYQIAKAKHSSGLMSLAGKVIGVVAAPFTGGASLALTAASMAGGK